MKYEQIKELEKKAFKRLTGVLPETFEKMVEIVDEAEKERREKGKNKGRKPELSKEDQILVMLDYYREYRTFFHIGVSYGVSEATANRVTRKIEKILIGSRVFRLPGKKKLLEQETEIEVVLIDASETPIERPKKNKRSTIVGRKRGIHSRAK